MYDDLAEILRRRIEVVQDPDEQMELYFRRGAIFSDALGDLEQSLKCYMAVSSKRAATVAPSKAIESIHFRREDWKKLLETYEKLIDCAETDAEMADIYARMARLCSDALNEEERAIELLGRVLDIRGESRRPSRPSRTSRRAAEVGRARRDRRASDRGRPGCGSDSALQAPRSHLGREARSASATHSMRGSPADRIDGNDLETLRSLGAAVSLHAGVGRAQPDHPPHHRRRPAVGRDRRDRDDRAVRTARSARR
jgi:tetratricopeptide (TPR) repeat protein